MSHVKTDKLSARTASGTVELGVSGETISIPSGVTISNSGTASGFSEPAYAANASASTGAVNVDASDNLQFDSGYGSTATAYGCRAWVNYTGSGTVAIRDSGNVSSVTDLAVGQYTVNFSTSMPDANYSTSVNGSLFDVLNDTNVPQAFINRLAARYTTSSVGISSTYKSQSISTFQDLALINVVVFR